MWIPQREYKKLGEVLSTARKTADITQKVLADKLGKPQSFVSSYEVGQRRVDVLEFVKIATAIGTNPEKLFAGVVAAAAAPKGKR